MALSNQSELPAFNSPRQVNLNIPINSGLRDAGIVCLWKITFVVVTLNSQPNNSGRDLPRMAKSWLTL
jgi:hypothetical protein